MGQRDGRHEGRKTATTARRTKLFGGCRPLLRSEAHLFSVGELRLEPTLRLLLLFQHDFVV